MLDRDEMRARLREQLAEGNYYVEGERRLALTPAGRARLHEASRDFGAYLDEVGYKAKDRRLRAEAETGG